MKRKYKLYILLFIIITFIGVHDYFREKLNYFVDTNQYIFKTGIFDGDAITNLEETTNTLITDYDTIFQQAIINNQGNYVIVARKEDDKNLFFYEYDKDYNLITKKMIFGPDMSDYDSRFKNNILSITQLPNHNYLLISYCGIILLSPDSDVITSYLYNNKHIFHYKIDFDNNRVSIYYQNEELSSIEEFDYELNLINIEEINNFIDKIYLLRNHKIIETNDESIVIIEYGTISKYSSKGDLIWENKLDFYLNDVYQASDGNLIIVGNSKKIKKLQKSKLFGKSEEIQPFQNGIIYKISNTTGQIMWKQEIRGYDSDLINLNLIMKNDNENLTIFGYNINTYGSLYYFGIQVDPKGNILGDKVFDYNASLEITKEVNDYISNYPYFYLYNDNNYIVFGTKAENGLKSPFFIQFDDSINKIHLNYFSVNHLTYYNIFIIIEKVLILGCVIIFVFFKAKTKLRHKIT